MAKKEAAKLTLEGLAEREKLDAELVIPAWEQLEGEPDVWYDRFTVYCYLGPGRTMSSAFRIYKETTLDADGEPTIQGKGPNSSWSGMAREWRWKQRAEAWDLQVHRQFREKLGEQVIGQKASRLKMITELRHLAFAALSTAEIQDFDRVLARKNLPELRRLLMDMINAERAELGEGQVDSEQGDSSVLTEIRDRLSQAYGGTAAPVARSSQEKA